MDRKGLKQYILDNYNCEVDHPWMKYPGHEVFRAKSSHKWFALIMNISQDKLGLTGKGMLDVVNLKCDPFLIVDLQREKGFFPAYHMSKTHWFTVALTPDVSDDKIKMLVDMSFEAVK